VIDPANPFTLKAIPTRYAGCYFRSRLEARWAVFFDTLDIKWQYEPEGFETPHGWYLPDFYLPEGGAWVEIKGGSFTKKDKARASYVAQHVWDERGDKFRVISGDIPRPGTRLIVTETRACVPAIPILGWALDCIPLCVNGEFRLPTVVDGKITEPAEFSWEELKGFPFSWKEMPWLPAYRDEKHFDEALTAARSARFEHGQSGT
jgi:hypothetical protein